MLKKDDPLYYKEKIHGLMKQALEEGLRVEVQVLEDGVKVYFEADNGDIAGVVFMNCRCSERYCLYNDGLKKCHYEGELKRDTFGVCLNCLNIKLR